MTSASSGCPTEHFVVLEPHNPSIIEFQAV